MVKYSRYSAKGKAVCTLTAVIVLLASVLALLDSRALVHADEMPPKQQERFAEESTRRQQAKEIFAVSGASASVSWFSRRSAEEILKEDWRLRLVNRANLLPEGYQIETRRLTNGLLVDARIYDPLMELMSAGNKEGCALMVCSAYRSYERQVELYEADIAKYQKMGYSYEKACAVTEETLALPGASEHQAGLSVDIVTVRHQVLNDAYADTKAGKWLAAHAHEYGFILRYPKEKEDITGISFEPWHFRYVGKEAAAEIYATECCLEEYLSEKWQVPLTELTGEAGTEK